MRNLLSSFTTKEELHLLIQVISFERSLKNKDNYAKLGLEPKTIHTTVQNTSHTSRQLIFIKSLIFIPNKNFHLLRRKKKFDY